MSRQKITIQIANGTIITTSEAKFAKSKCKYCGKPIIWIKTKFKSVPVNRIGTNKFTCHFLECQPFNSKKHKSNDNIKRN